MPVPPSHPNRLIHETSPYLLQHAHNPVDWFPWGEEALGRARTEQKPILVSIGYAACHWCHVMERESFEHEQIARVMNERFVCIKVDREERPDVDQVYLDAVQAMGVGGGWPLNVFLTPEAKPFYGGTYFPPRQWFELLQQVANAYQSANRPALDQSAEDFARVLRATELEKYGVQPATAGLRRPELRKLLGRLEKSFDRARGGTGGAPKFPMPAIWRLLLRAQQLTGQPSALQQTALTLTEMAWGGIYDQVGGGFARYSVDEQWRVPHFEKMLYDNGQLVSLYAEAYQVTQDEHYRAVVQQTVAFVQRELLSPEGGFYASLDADSEGEEGRFYVFTLAELYDVLGDEASLAADYYQCTALGNWEHGRNVLHRRQSDTDFAAAHQLAPGVVAELVRGWQQRLLAYRSRRVRPSLDDKILTGWNALMLRGLCDAYRAFADAEYLALARQNAAFIEANLVRADTGGLWRSWKAGHGRVVAFLEDYSLLIDAYVSLYEVTFEERWLRRAGELTEYALAHFSDAADPHLFYTDAAGEALIARKKELFDNVIPSSNSVMAHNLLRLGTLLDVPAWRERAAAMLAQVQPLAVKEPQHLAHWAALYLSLLCPLAEVAIVGPDAEALRRQLSRHPLPNAVLSGSPAASELPLLQGRFRPDQTTIYVCYRHACHQPVHSVAEALVQLQAAWAVPSP
ncbi:thioredoxin domain-containing protein [Hymenobacter sp. B81]|uniref:thioredoxin domain-containing protein n=1 Tax=Hymenobacter sp. B81 TaxID=3344878 RepID=UPI0037DCC8D2